MIVTVFVVEPATMAPVPPAPALIWPETTDTVTVTRPAPASTSATDSVPARLSSVCSVALYEAGALAVGASFTGLTVIATLSESVIPPASVDTTVSVSAPL